MADTNPKNPNLLPRLQDAIGEWSRDEPDSPLVRLLQDAYREIDQRRQRMEHVDSLLEQVRELTDRAARLAKVTHFTNQGICHNCEGKGYPKGGKYGPAACLSCVGTGVWLTPEERLAKLQEHDQKHGTNEAEKYRKAIRDGEENQAV